MTSTSFSQHAYDKMIGLYQNHEHEVGRKYTGDKTGKQSTDCITYVINVLSYAFEQVGDTKAAAEVRKRGNGIPLAKYLTTLGWKAYYWNPDVAHPRDNDDEHPYSYKVAKSKSTYYEVPISGLVVNYYPTTHPKPTAVDQGAIGKLNCLHFAYGLARGAKHTFLFGSGFVYEVHWDAIGDGLYERSPFQSYEWLSGLLVVPPDLVFGKCDSPDVPTPPAGSTH